MRKKDNWIGTVQLAMWVGVVLAEMAVVGSLPAEAAVGSFPAEAAEEITVRSAVCRSREECGEPEAKYLLEDGGEYELLSWETVRVPVKGHVRQLRRETGYEAVEGQAEIPEILPVTVEEDGETMEVACRLEECRMTREVWEDGLQIPVTFCVYDADYYELGGRLIPHDDAKPRLEGCEEEILALAGLAPEEYRIQEIRWSGEAYRRDGEADRRDGAAALEDGEVPDGPGDAPGGPGAVPRGELCRDALAVGQKLVRDYRAVYTGTAEFPDYDGWQTVAVYGPAAPETKAETEPESTAREKEKAAEVTLPQPEASTGTDEAPLTLLQRITRTLLITVAAGALCFFGGLLILGGLQVAKIVRACYNGKD